MKNNPSPCGDAGKPAPANASTILAPLARDASPTEADDWLFNIAVILTWAWKAARDADRLCHGPESRLLPKERGHATPALIGIVRALKSASDQALRCVLKHQGNGPVEEKLSALTHPISLRSAADKSDLDLWLKQLWQCLGEVTEVILQPDNRGRLRGGRGIRCRTLLRAVRTAHETVGGILCDYFHVTPWGERLQVGTPPPQPQPNGCPLVPAALARLDHELAATALPLNAGERMVLAVRFSSWAAQLQTTALLQWSLEKLSPPEGELAQN